MNTNRCLIVWHGRPDGHRPRDNGRERQLKITPPRCWRERGCTRVIQGELVSAWVALFLHRQLSEMGAVHNKRRERRRSSFRVPTFFLAFQFSWAPFSRPEKGYASIKRINSHDSRRSNGRRAHRRRHR